jgi:hypothetical protein
MAGNGWGRNFATGTHFNDKTREYAGKTYSCPSYLLGFKKYCAQYISG